MSLTFNMNASPFENFIASDRLNSSIFVVLFGFDREKSW